MTNQQYRLIQDVKKQKEITSILEAKVKSLEGMNNINCKIMNNINNSLLNNIEDLDFLSLNFSDLKNDFKLGTKLLLATATLTIITFIMLVITISAL